MPRKPVRLRTLAKRYIKFEGSDELLADLEKLASEMAGKEMKEGLMRRVGIPLRDKARSLVAVKTGNLRRGIFAAYGDENLTTILVGVNDKIAPHAHLVEFGHAGPQPAPPHPYMRPAVAQSTESARKGIEETYREIIQKYS